MTTDCDNGQAGGARDASDDGPIRSGAPAPSREAGLRADPARRPANWAWASGHAHYDWMDHAVLFAARDGAAEEAALADLAHAGRCIP